MDGAPVEVDTTITVMFDIPGSNIKGIKLAQPPHGYKRVDYETLEKACTRTPAIAPPLYPPIYGDVAVQFSISPEGTIENVHAVNGIEMLREPAEDNVKSWRCTPLVDKKGTTKGIDGVVAIKFRSTPN